MIMSFLVKKKSTYMALVSSPQNQSGQAKRFTVFRIEKFSIIPGRVAHALAKAAGYRMTMC